MAAVPTLAALPPLPTAPPQPGEVVEEILVIVNGRFISRRTFQQAVEQEHAALYRQYSGKELDEKLRDAREKTLQGLIDARLMEDKAVDLGMASLVSDEYMRTYVEDVKKQNNFATDGDFERALRSSIGIGLKEYIERQKLQMTQQEVLRREVFSKIAIEDQELRAYYEDHKEEYRLPSRFRIRELVIAKQAGMVSENSVLTSILEALKGGRSFEELVKEHSTSPSKGTGGDLGWLNKGFMRKEIEDAAFSLKPGEVSPPLETDKDIYLIQVIGAEKDPLKSFQDVKQQLMEKLQEPKAQNAIEQYMQSLRVRANIRFMVAKEQVLKG
jgi:parvulin-like peptidyl-prolyl isomerase